MMFSTQMIMLRIFVANIRTWIETTELADLGEKKLQNATN